MVKVRDTSTNGVGLKAAQWRSFFQPRCHFGPMDVGLGIGHAWRIIPLVKWLITMVIVCPPK